MKMSKLNKLQRICLSNSYQCMCRFSSDIKPVQDKSESSTETAVTTPKSNDAKDFIWRTSWHEKERKRLDVLRAFYKEDNNTSLLKWVQTPVNLSPSSIKNWWLRKKENAEAFMQQYVPERHQMLGPELAAAHFILFRGGSVKFHNENKWIKAEKGEYQLPATHRNNMLLQAIDCTDMNLHYEGLDNLRDLKSVEWLSFNGCRYIDDFCIDAISNMFAHSLLYLDIRNCFNISERGIGALYKMRKLKILYLDDMLKDTKYELTCLLLQELNHSLDVKSDVINFEIK